MRGLVLATILAAIAGSPMAASDPGDGVTPDARRVANWVLKSGDNAALPFIIIDKRRAEVMVFDTHAALVGEAHALLGRAIGDDSVPGIGTRRLSAIRPYERTTPAGRFVAALGQDLDTDVLWIDYDAALSLHRVIKGAPSEQRARRLASSDPEERRISYGCVNVPAAFYDGVVRKTFGGPGGIVYILPEVKTLETVFHLPGDDATASESSLRRR
jgi:hypothetical protein